jgi:hypothetical protein
MRDPTLAHGATNPLTPVPPERRRALKELLDFPFGHSVPAFARIAAIAAAGLIGPSGTGSAARITFN